jgi:putative Mg2+ transporter-C (MgtC) family protein
MDWFIDAVTSTRIDLLTTGIRLCLAVILGGLIGMERETHKQLAGFRTHILICVGSTLLMILSIYIAQSIPDVKAGDPGRIAAQVVTGVGFLGAGAIMRIGANVRGITTAATIWVVAAVGLVVGAGMYLAAIICTGIIIFTLIVLDKFEKRLFQEHFFKTVRVYFTMCVHDTDPVVDLVKNHKIKVKTTEVTHLFEKNKTRLTIYIDVAGHMDTKAMCDTLRKHESIGAVSIENTR